MLKKALREVVNRMPDPLRDTIRERYWQAKSSLLYRHLYRVLDLEYTLPSGLLLKIGSKGEWWVYNEIFVGHGYDVPIHRALESRSAARPFTVLDLGANVGFFFLRVIDLMRQCELRNLSWDITLVEGSPAVHRELQERLRLQGLLGKGLRVVNGLVGQRSGSGAIRESAIHVKNTILHTRPGNSVKVDFVDLARLMEERPTVDLLKCDIEGAEQMFIENYGDLLGRVKHAVFEFHHEQCDTGKCTRLLEQAGFSRQILHSNAEVSICLFSRN